MFDFEKFKNFTFFKWSSPRWRREWEATRVGTDPSSSHSMRNRPPTVSYIQYSSHRCRCQVVDTFLSFSKLDNHLKKLVLCTVNVDFLRIEYMVLAKYQHMSILEFILIIKQHILILCKKSNPCYPVGFCTEIHIHQGNMSSLVGKVVSNTCYLCVKNLWTLPLPPAAIHIALSWELRKCSLQK
jgi:hypothetical protein